MIRVKAELLLNAFVGNNPHELSLINIDDYSDIRRFSFDKKSLKSAKQFLENKGFDVIGMDYHPFNKK